MTFTNPERRAVVARSGGWKDACLGTRARERACREGIDDDERCGGGGGVF